MQSRCRKEFSRRLRIVFPPLFAGLLLWSAPLPGLGPEPGDVYREYTKSLKVGDNWRVTDPKAGAAGAKEFLPNPVLNIRIDDLEGALRAEAEIDRWGGHPGTSNKRVRFNGNDWIKLPELTTTPQGQNPNCYMHQDNPVFEVPLEHLVEGANTFEGTCGAQSCFSFDWGQWGWYSMILRVYYDSTKAHPRGRITSPAAGEWIGENPSIAAEASSDAGVARVQFQAFFEAYDFDGDGIYLQWQRRYSGTFLNTLLGGVDNEPYRVTWDTKWVPDQQPGAVKVLARIRDNNGYWFVTDAVENLSLVRDTTSVKLYPARSVPRKFWVRANQKMYCRINIPETEPLGLATAVSLHLRTWNGIGERFELNGDYSDGIEGDNHSFKYSIRQVPLSALVYGDNRVSFQSSTEQHGVEILWPGPGLIVRYRLFTEDLATCDFNGDGVAGLDDLVGFVLLGRHYPHDPRLDWNRDGTYEINDLVALLRDIVQGSCPDKGSRLAAVSAPGREAAVRRLSAGEVEYLEKVFSRLDLTVEQQAALRLSLQELAEGLPARPGELTLRQNTPNPFNPVTSISFSVPEGGPLRVRLAIYDLRGRRLRTLVDETKKPGGYTFFWDGTDRQGADLPNGIYLYRLEAGGRVLTRKMVLLK
ncbi:MAG: T9SS type A sorting domain-containing protein [Candidatus Glassbacteria bacterium]|nr:T9SS type A sorting domain-containing protein [Candidatus Glassbacteria bacterium]